MRVVVDADADAVGRMLREQLESGARVAGFVGEVESDRDALDEFVRDVVRDES